FLGLLPAHAAVVIGPWLEGDTTTNVDVLVECDSAAVMTVNYGVTTNYGASAFTTVTNSTGNGSDFIHRIKLTGLQSNMLYHYQLEGQGASAADFNFATMAPTYLVAGITLAEAPVTVSNAVMAVANGRAVEKINRVTRLEGQQFYAYIADTLGPQLLTVSINGGVLINARVAPFADLPQVIQEAAKTAVAGRLQVCRRATQTSGPFVLPNSQSPYVIDYMLNEDEPVFALLRETDGWVRASYGYYEDDPD
ncbi:MAG: hypothetical protein NT154_28180, partial [Verrucomicrobia bacterium]|nr:hypothetical protein [Verrucomicrobiota bacterium]